MAPGREVGGRLRMTMLVSAAIRIPASSGGRRSVNSTIPSASVRQRTLRNACWWASSSAGSVLSRRHTARARPNSAAGTSIAMANSSASLSGVATRVSVRTFEYDSRPASNAPAMSGRSRSFVADADPLTRGAGLHIGGVGQPVCGGRRVQHPLGGVGEVRGEDHEPELAVGPLPRHLDQRGRQRTRARTLESRRIPYLDHPVPRCDATSPSSDRFPELEDRPEVVVRGDGAKGLVELRSTTA